MRLPIRARLTLVSGALMAAVLTAMGAFVYLRLEVELRDAVDAGLRSRAQIVLSDPTVIASAGSRIVDPEEAFAQLLGRDGRVVETSPGLPADALLCPEQVAGLTGVRFFDAQIEMPTEVVPVRLLATPAGAAGVMVVGASVEDQRDALARLLVLLAFTVPVAVALASGVGWLVARAALRPVEQLRAEADAVSSSEPGRRLPVSGAADELTRLGTSLNLMLERLEEAAERERRFLGDASHELRTPLANLKVELDLALRRARSPEELTAALRSAADETDRLARLAEDLLGLARAEGGRLPLRRERLDIGQLIRDEVGSFAGRASTLGIAIRAHAEEVVEADLDGPRIRQAIGNLIDNALRHTPRGGGVAVELVDRPGSVVIEVTDSGTGFDPSFVHRATEPFSRSDPARRGPDGGAGLGLAIVRAVAEAHGGSVEARNRPEGGALVALHLPR